MRWRTVDIVVTAALGVAFGVVFWAWGLLFSAVAAPAFAPPLYILSGVWLIPAVLAPLIVRLPGAALLAETMAAAVSALLGSVWGLDTLMSGLMQGAGAELVFALALYRRWTLPITLLAAAGAGVGEWIHDMTFYFVGVPIEIQLAYGAWMLVSAVLVAGLGSWYLVKLLRPTGVLAAFPAGQDVARSTG
ncbi:MAG TPA: ECF transporter S component [Candidatus Limnocylindria bacterium]|jgi:energy-coupling factor transport system substrate-specific component|nr:ECF transporter S component [Candidatus Limnocylindria bacterium]